MNSYLLFLFVSLTMVNYVFGSGSNSVLCETMTCAVECNSNPCDCSEANANNCNICHNNQGCSQCQSNYFKKGFNYQCQSCSAIDNCLHCADIHGCQQCAQGYNRVLSDQCGLYYCITDGCYTLAPTDSPTDDPTPSPTADPTPSPTADPTPSPTNDPTPSPTDEPSNMPTPSELIIESDDTGFPMELSSNSAAASNTITLSHSGYNNALISKLRVFVLIDHTWIGDLSINLLHVASGTNVLVNQFGDCNNNGCGCSQNNMKLWYDDDGTIDECSVCDACDGNTNDVCTAQSGDIIPHSSLSTFNGLSPNSDWIMTITDNCGGDSGNWLEWALDISF